MRLKNVLLISVFSIGMTLFIANGVRGSESEWRSLGEQEKEVILDEIADRLAKLRSIGISYDWKDGLIDKNGKEDIGGEYSLFNVFDHQRNYQLKSRPGGISKKVDADPNSDFAHLSEHCWNGSLRWSLDHRSRTGSIRGKIGLTRAEESTVFTIIGRNSRGESWLMRYQNRDVLDNEYDVEVNGNNEYRVTERPKRDVSVFSRNIAIFDRKKGMAITRYSEENVFRDDNRVFRVSDTFFDDFRQVNGFYIPFKISRKVNIDMEPPMNSVQYVTVKEVTINDISHDKFLRNFIFPNGSKIYDYILKMPVNVGGDSEELENVLNEGLLQAKNEIDQDKIDLDENISQVNAKPELTDNSVESDSSKKVNSSPVTKGRQNTPYVLGLILLGLFIVLAVIVRMVMKKRSTGCGVFIIICCSALLGSDVFADDTRKFRSYDTELLEDLIPEHQAIHKRDLTRLCGINVLYQAYLWVHDSPQYSYRDLMKMVNYIDGVTMEELLDCAKQIGLEAQAKMVNYKYLLEPKKSAQIALVTVPGRKAHFILFLGTESTTSTYYIDYPNGQGHVSESFMLARLKLLGVNPESIPIIEFPNPDVLDNISKKLIFTPSRIKIHADKPWLLGKTPLAFEGQLQNNNSKNIEILKIKSSCGCVDVRLDKMMLKPGEKVRVTGNIDVTPGSPSSANIVVFDNLGNSASFKVDAEVPLPFKVTQKTLSFGALAANDSKVLSFDVFVKNAYRLLLKDPYVGGEVRDSYALDTSVGSPVNVLLSEDAVLYTKYTIMCKIVTTDCKPLYAVHDLALPFIDEDGYEAKYIIPVRFEVLETIYR